MPISAATALSQRAWCLQRRAPWSPSRPHQLATVYQVHYVVFVFISTCTHLFLILGAKPSFVLV